MPLTEKKKKQFVKLPEAQHQYLCIISWIKRTPCDLKTRHEGLLASLHPDFPNMKTYFRKESYPTFGFAC